MPEITLNEKPFDIQLLLSYWAAFASTDGSVARSASPGRPCNANAR